MKRRYDLRRSDNYMYSGKISQICSGSGTIYVYTGFPVTSATVSFASIPCNAELVFSSSSSSSYSDSDSFSSESSSSIVGPTLECPRIYVSSYDTMGFYVAYEGILPSVGYIEFTYNAV